MHRSLKNVFSFSGDFGLVFAQTPIPLNLTMKEVEIGSSVILECDVVYPRKVLIPKSIKWSKQDRVSGRSKTILYRIFSFTPWLHSTYAHRLSIHSGATLQLEDVRLSDAGIYRCEVEFELEKGTQIQKQLIGINVFREFSIRGVRGCEIARVLEEFCELRCAADAKKGSVI